jgi:hypothetical protein
MASGRGGAASRGPGPATTEASLCALRLAHVPEIVDMQLGPFEQLDRLHGVQWSRALIFSMADLQLFANKSNQTHVMYPLRVGTFPIADGVQERLVLKNQNTWVHDRGGCWCGGWPVRVFRSKAQPGIALLWPTAILHQHNIWSSRISSSHILPCVCAQLIQRITRWNLSYPTTFGSLPLSLPLASSMSC